MKNIKKLLIISIALLSLFGLGTLVSSNTFAANDICSRIKESDNPQLYRANGCGGTSTTDIANVVVNIINGVVVSLGLVAAVFIVVGGINYMTSAGDAGKIEKAKKTILYAVIGLVVAALAFAIVNFAIGIINGNSAEESKEEESVDGGGPISLLIKDLKL